MTEQHPIQLVEILVSRLSIVINDNMSAQEFDGDITLSMQRGTSNFDPLDEHIAVGMRAHVVPDQGESIEPSFEIEVELNGQFKVDYDRFNFEDLERWALVNAPTLLLPYVREQIYGLGLRAGLKNMIIPLFVQPKQVRKVDATPDAPANSSTT